MLTIARGGVVKQSTFFPLKCTVAFLSLKIYDVLLKLLKFQCGVLFSCSGVLSMDFKTIFE